MCTRQDTERQLSRYAFTHSLSLSLSFSPPPPHQPLSLSLFPAVHHHIKHKRVLTFKSAPE
ncbi:MAG: hypothetical protein MJE68_34185 [Proteobacteria bacterium]|nr:hypothetical protein [Pseudomonadota bacterium]